jgi:hypothetical protein
MKNAEPSSEVQTVIPVEQLPAYLGFMESDELRSMRGTVVEAMASGNHTAITEQLSRYQELGEEIVDQLQDEAFTQGQIGLIVATALLWRDAGNPVSYGVELRNALRYAGNKKFTEVEQALDAAYKEVEAEHEASKGSAYIGPPTEEIIAVCKRELPVEVHEELDFLYPLPPDEVLEEVAALMIGMDIEEHPDRFFGRMGWTEPQAETGD